MDEGRKRVIGIMAAILAARKLAQWDGGKRVSAAWLNERNGDVTPTIVAPAPKANAVGLLLLAGKLSFQLLRESEILQRKLVNEIRPRLEAA